MSNCSSKHNIILICIAARGPLKQISRNTEQGITGLCIYLVGVVAEDEGEDTGLADRDAVGDNTAGRIYKKTKSISKGKSALPHHVYACVNELRYIFEELNLLTTIKVISSKMYA